MAKSRLNSLSDRFFSILFHILLLQFPATTFGIRTDAGLLKKPICINTVQGRYLISDDNGYVCDALSRDTRSRCCPEIGDRFPCQGCNLVSQCCNSYEFCVSCCLNPSQTKKELALTVKRAKPVTAGTYGSVFDFCAGRCRHNSASVVHENAYASDFHHCFFLPTNSSGATDTPSEARLTGITVVIGRQGESCNSVCKAKGQSCVPNKLLVLNTCELLQKYMTCKGACLASIGGDQPAEVVDDAPNHLNPGACLYSQSQAMLSCDGSHQHTRYTVLTSGSFSTATHNFDLMGSSAQLWIKFNHAPEVSLTGKSELHLLRLQGLGMSARRILWYGPSNVGRSVWITKPPENARVCHAQVH